ncbi:MAG: glycosyltransferase family 4 protein [Acidobacteria bacterium]|nr:glycosyltransferase family 4 protein [Acidobacteriota bacterium]
MTVLYLTNNRQLAGTGRILTSWLTLGREAGIHGRVVVPGDGQMFEWLRQHEVPVLASAMPWLNPWRPWPSARAVWRVARWARAGHVRLVHCNEHDVYPFAVLVARLLRVPIVCHVRFKLDPGFGRWAFGTWRQPDALLWTTAQQRADSVEAVAGIVPEARQHLIPLGPDPAVFRPAGDERDALRQAFDIRPDELAIGAATALRPIKRLHDFVDMIAALASRHPNVVGLIAGGAVPGEEAYRASIEQRIAATGLGRRLRWIGHRDAIDPFLRSLDLFVSTSEYETFGNSVCEAMACGVPVVGYVGGSVHEIIGEAGIVVPNGDLARLVAAVEALTTDPELRARLADAGRSRATAEFSPRASFQKLRGIYERLSRSPAAT